MNEDGVQREMADGTVVSELGGFRRVSVRRLQH